MQICGSNEANHLHIFWKCLQILAFWQEIHKSLENIFHIPVDLSFLIVNLGLKNPVKRKI